MRVDPGLVKTGVTIFAVAAIAAVLLMGANFVVDTSYVTSALSSSPRDFMGFVSNSLSDYRFWTVVVILALAAIIGFIQVVPAVKKR